MKPRIIYGVSYLYMNDVLEYNLLYVNLTLRAIHVQTIFLNYGPILFVYFHHFLIPTSHTVPISTLHNEKSIDGVLRIQIQGRRMVGADKTTEQWNNFPTRISVAFHRWHFLLPNERRRSVEIVFNGRIELRMLSSTWPVWPVWPDWPIFQSSWQQIRLYM